MNVYSDMVYQVAEHKPAQVSLYDYYDPEQQVYSFSKILLEKLCHISDLSQFSDQTDVFVKSPPLVGRLVC